MNKPILLVASQHGNELLGEKLHKHITDNHHGLLQLVDYHLANTEARRKFVRYIESDMNRSFIKNNTSYEGRQAKKLLKLINKNQYQLILDLHTTTADQEPCLLVNTFSNSVKKYIRGSNTKQVIKISDNLAAHSLIGNCPRALSVEVNEANVNVEFLESIVTSLTAFLANTKTSSTCTVFEVDSLLLPQDLEGSSQQLAVNLQLYNNQFYPILLGEVAYKQDGSYLGFKAKEKYQLKV